MALEVIEHNGTRYAEVIWADTRVETTTFFSPPESSFQFGLLAHKAGFVEAPHYHKPINREINDLQQMFIVQRGVVIVELYDDDNQLLREVELKAGDAIALIHGPQQLSYDELEQEANRFARYLQSQSVVANDVVAVMLPRSPQLMVAVLGVLKAGATYLPVDPSYPEDRILYMLADAQVKFAIGQNALAQSIENQPC